MATSSKRKNSTITSTEPESGARPATRKRGSAAATTEEQSSQQCAPSSANAASRADATATPATNRPAGPTSGHAIGYPSSFPMMPMPGPMPPGFGMGPMGPPPPMMMMWMQQMQQAAMSAAMYCSWRAAQHHAQQQAQQSGTMAAGGVTAGMPNFMGMGMVPTSDTTGCKPAGPQSSMMGPMNMMMGSGMPWPNMMPSMGCNMGSSNNMGGGMMPPNMMCPPPPFCMPQWGNMPGAMFGGMMNNNTFNTTASKTGWFPTGAGAMPGACSAMPDGSQPLDLQPPAGNLSLDCCAATTGTGLAPIMGGPLSTPASMDGSAGPVVHDSPSMGTAGAAVSGSECSDVTGVAGLTMPPVDTDFASFIDTLLLDQPLPCENQVDLSDILAGTPEMGLPASTSMAAKGAVSQQPGLSSPANVDGGSAGGPPLRLKLGRDEMRELMRSASIAKS